MQEKTKKELLNIADELLAIIDGIQTKTNVGNKIVLGKIVPDEIPADEIEKKICANCGETYSGDIFRCNFYDNNEKRTENIPYCGRCGQILSEPQEKEFLKSAQWKGGEKLNGNNQKLYEKEQDKRSGDRSGVGEVANAYKSANKQEMRK
jgi:hypothetical protein